MRILLVTPMVPARAGNGAIPVLLHAELVGLLERGHEVALVTAAGDEPGEADAVRALPSEDLTACVVDRRQPATVRGRQRRRARLASTWVRRDWPWRTVWFAAPGIQDAIDELAARRRFDVAAIEDSSMSVFRLPAAVPGVLTEHEVRRPRPFSWRRGGTSWPASMQREIDWRRWPGFQRAAWARFDRVQVFGSRDAEAIAALAPGVGPRVRVNPFGIDLPPPADPSREVPGTILFVGNFTHEPNRDAAAWLACEIMPRVQQRRPDARLRIVGGSPTEGVRALAGESVDVVGNAPTTDTHLEEASIVLAPVRIGGGMRMKVLEALARGKAVVTTRRGAEGFLDLDADPPLSIAETADEIAAATLALLDDPPSRRDLGLRARAFAETYHSPGAWAARLEQVFEEAMNDRRPPH